MKQVRYRFPKDLVAIIRAAWRERNPAIVLSFLISRLHGSQQEWVLRPGRCHGWVEMCGKSTHWLSDVTFYYQCPDCNNRFWRDYFKATRHG